MAEKWLCCQVAIHAFIHRVRPCTLSARGERALAMRTHMSRRKAVVMLQLPSPASIASTATPIRIRKPARCPDVHVNGLVRICSGSAVWLCCSFGYCG